MIKEKAKELAKILIAYSEGKIIEEKHIESTKWVVIRDLVLDNRWEYRIKPEPKLVPFTFEDNKLFKDKWVMQKKEFGGCGYLNRIVGISDKNIIMINSDGVIMSKSYEDLLRIYTFEDGSPCGKYIEE